MRYKRLYYNPAIHGGGVGTHDLMQGHAIADLVYAGPGWLRVLAVLAGVLPGDSFDVGTIDQPGLVTSAWPAEYDSLDTVALIDTQPRLVTSSSSWAVTVNQGTFTAGVYEFLIPLWLS